MVRHYPKIKDKDFNLICKKREFRKYTTKRTKVSNFEDTLLLPHQQFIANYIHPTTPYKGLLVYHETGTGKTCTAVSVAENFKQSVVSDNKKIIILSSENIKHEFKKTIKSSETVFKCTGYTYTKDLDKEKLGDKYDSKLNEMIDKFYTFKTYQSFGNELLKKFKKFDNITLDKCQSIVRDEFSNTLLIIDEAHNLRSKTGFNSVKKHSTLETWLKTYLNKNKANFDEEDEESDDDEGDNEMDEEKKKSKKKKDNKISRDAIDIIIDYAVNLRILFLTATPMFDNPSEIIWIINKLNKIQDKNFDELLENEILDKDNFDFKSQDSMKKFIEAIQGKVSYLRSGDPNKFPLRIESDKLTYSKLSKEHSEIINNYDIESDSIFSKILLHNVSWYKVEKKDKNKKNKKINDFSGAEKHFDIKLLKKPTIYEFKKKNDILDNLDIYAPKIQKIVDMIENMKDGIAFVFSKFVWSGILPLALALENKGYYQYKEGNEKKYLLKNRNINDSNNCYAIISSSSNLSFEKQENVIKAVRSEANKNGKNIKVILASSSGGEGIDLKNIRQVHILEPHFNFSLMEQVIGRAVRTDSHKSLTDENRNCSIFYHATQHENGIEGIEDEIYQNAKMKRKGVQKIRKLLQEYSVTCDFFKETNEFKLSHLKGKQIRDSFGNMVSYNPSENDDLYKTNCKLCKKSNIENVKEDLDTYHPHTHSKSQILVCIKWIKELFEVNEVMLLDDIIQFIQSRNQTFDKETIFYTMELLDNNYEFVFRNIYGINGLIFYDEPFYKFKPDYSDYTGRFNFTPFVYTNEGVPLKDIIFSERPIISSSKNPAIELLFQKTLNSINFLNDGFWDTKDRKNVRDLLLAQALVDKVTDNERYDLNKNYDTIPDVFKKAIDFYRKDNGFLKISQITEPNKIVNISNEERIEKNKKLQFPNSKDLPLSSFITIEKGNYIFKVLDRRKTKGVGANLGSAGDATKKKLVEIINTLLETYCIHHKIPVFKRYTFIKETDDTRTFDLSNKTTKPNNKNMYLECELFFRLLQRDDIQNKLWFIPSWNMYHYGLPESAKK